MANDWPRIPQSFDFAQGEVVGDVFYRINGYSGALRAAPGIRVPLIHLVVQNKAQHRGRPLKEDRPRAKPATRHLFSSYGLDNTGQWWNVLHTPGLLTARARSLTHAPYSVLSGGRGMRRNYGHQKYLAGKAVERLGALQYIEDLRARCPLI